MRTVYVTDTRTSRDTVGDILGDLASGLGAMRCIGSQRLLRAGISMTHLHVLTLLRHHGAMPMSRVADFLDGSTSSASGIVDRMAERGLVTRVRVPDDRRVVLVQPTDAGLGLVDEVEILRGDMARAVLQRLSTVQLSRLSETVTDLRGAIAEELASAPERYAAFTSHAPSHAPAVPADDQSVAGASPS